MENNLGNKEIMAKNIKRYMELNGVSSVDMCHALGVPQSTFSYWINAKTYPRIDKIEKMAEFFHINKADLVEDNFDFIQLFAEQMSAEETVMHNELNALYDRLSPNYQSIALNVLKALWQQQEDLGDHGGSD